MKTTNKLSEMEKGVRELFQEEKAVWIKDKDVDMSVFAEYPKERQGIAVYYPMFKDGSCAEAEYISFFRSAKGMSIELASEKEYALQERERIGWILRRAHAM